MLAWTWLRVVGRLELVLLIIMHLSHDGIRVSSVHPYNLFSDHSTCSFLLPVQTKRYLL